MHAGASGGDEGSLEQRHDGDASARPPTPPAASARVRLEVEILGSELAAQREVPVPVAAPNTHERRTILIVAADASLRRYVRECLRDVTRFLVRDVASAREALELVVQAAPRVAVVDRTAEFAILRVFAEARVVVIDDGPRADGVPRDPRLVVLMSPFSAEALITAIDRLLP